MAKKAKRQSRAAAGKKLARALTASAAVDAAEQRRAAARERYAALKRDPKRYEAMLVKARERAARFHERRRKAAKKAQARGKKAGSR